MKHSFETGTVSRQEVTVAALVVIFALTWGCSPEDAQRKSAPKEVVRKAIIQPTSGVATDQVKNLPEKTTPMKAQAAPRAENRLSPSRLSGDLPESRPPREGVYEVREGDTLGEIAAREDVYGDPLKWPILYWNNRDSVKQKGVRGDVPRLALPDNLDLRFVTPQKAAESLTDLGQKPWVVNVLSEQETDPLVPLAVTLMKKGYPVYLSRARVKGKEWFRLRVGFFEGREKALAVRDEIMSRLGIKGCWVDKSPEDLQEFGGYLG